MRIFKPSPRLARCHSDGKEAAFVAGFFFGFADCGFGTVFANVAAAFREKPGVAVFVVDEANLAGRLFDEDGAGGFEEGAGGVERWWGFGGCHYLGLGVERKERVGMILLVRRAI
jgi:hypothetical protein